jgi:competence ComEA-like helix-hairpin-helix protein
MICLSVLLALASSANAQLPDGKGKDVVERVCNSCHGSNQIIVHRMSKKDWSDKVDIMLGYGASATDDEIAQIIDYFATHLGKLVNVNKASSEEIQDGLSLSAKDADAITKYREQNGTYKQLTDLTNVPGVDIAKIREQKDNIVF